jgi:hypothetical protein
MKSKIKLFYILLISILLISPTPVKAYDDWGGWDDWDYYDDWDDWDDWDNDSWYDDDPYDWGAGSDDVYVYPDDNDEPYDWGLDDDWWRDAYVYDDDDDYNSWDWEEDYDDPPSSGNDNQDNSENDPDKQKEAIIDKIVKDLEKKTGLKVGEVKIGHRTSVAYYHAPTGTIYVCDAWFLKSENNRISIIYHEYTHKTKDHPVQRDKNGAFITINTGERINLTEREIAEIKKDCAEEKEIYHPVYQEKMEEACVKIAMESEYAYKPSNYALNEMQAYQSQLDGEKDGYWKFTDEERKEIQHGLDSFTDSYNRALEYEKKNNMNPDGSKKK